VDVMQIVIHERNALLILFERNVIVVFVMFNELLRPLVFHHWDVLIRLVEAMWKING
jgi:hypothetical protein